MKRIDIAFQKLNLFRSEIVEDFCPFNVDFNLPDIDFDTFKHETECVSKGCRGITCEECWENDV